MRPILDLRPPKCATLARGVLTATFWIPLCAALAAQAAPADWREVPALYSRQSAAMAYDMVRERVVLFGGVDLGRAVADTWERDGTVWNLRTTTTAPSRRSRHAMAYDLARQRVVLFGGTDGRILMGDTWEWDGVNWTQRAPAARPWARSQHAMAYDVARQRVVLFGGDGQGSFASDTWEMR